jgi:aminoglycoside 6-adenylyltransferase
MQELLRTIVGWAHAQDPIRVLILTGSTATSPTPDELADFDIAIFATDPSVYTSADAWMSEIGPIWNCLALSNEDEGGYPTRLIVYDGGCKVDFTLAPLAALDHLVASELLPDVYRRGYRVLLDKDHRATRLPPPLFRARQTEKPSEAEFSHLIIDFWHEAYHVPKYLARDDLWLVKERDGNMKGLLLDMLAWYMKSKKGWDYDTFYLGKHIKNWLDPELYAALSTCFAHFDRDDSWAAFFATARLFGHVAEQAAGRLGYPYSPEMADHFLGLARELHDISTRS